MRGVVLGSALALFAVGTAPALAATAYVGQTMTVHAGPGAIYPALERLPPDTRLWVHGCREARDWCDVSHGRMRGWVAAGGLTVPQGSQTAENLPVANFELDRYWGENYRREPFYADRATWADPARQLAERAAP